MTCIDHGKKVGGDPSFAGEPLDLAPLAHSFGAVAAALGKIGASLDKIDESIARLKLAVHVDPPAVHVAAPRVEVHAPDVTVEPRIEVIVEKQLPPIVNVHVPEGKAPEIVVNPTIDPAPIVLHTSDQSEKSKGRDYLLCALPCALLICDIVVRILHL